MSGLHKKHFLPSPPGINPVPSLALLFPSCMAMASSCAQGADLCKSAFVRLWMPICPTCGTATVHARLVDEQGRRDMLPRFCLFVSCVLVKTKGIAPAPAPHFRPRAGASGLRRGRDEPSSCPPCLPRSQAIPVHFVFDSCGLP